MIPNWEYKVLDITIEESNLEKELNQLGLEGWELVAYPDGELAIFKRRQLSLCQPYTGEEIHRTRPEKRERISRNNEDEITQINWQR